MAGNCCQGRMCDCRVNDRYSASYNPLKDPAPQCTCTRVCKERMEGTYGTPRSPESQPSAPSSKDISPASGCGCLLLVVLLVIAVIVIFAVVKH